MPVMDGFEATRRLRARGITLPVIALTASLPAEVEKDVQNAGLTDIVVKPFNPDALAFPSGGKSQPMPVIVDVEPGWVIADVFVIVKVNVLV